MEAGETVIEPVVAPVFQRSVPSQPDATRVTVSPIQIVGFELTICTAGRTGVNVIGVEEGLTHPFMVQVAEYVVTTVGETDSVFPVAPVDQVTVPVQFVALSTMVSPTQSVFFGA